jgi:aryl-alcohol dehydrogenase-like predicted oxidoreductase
MQKRPLGKSGLSIAPLAFGGNVCGWTADEATSFRILDAFIDAGFNCIDTADSYSAWVPGHVGGESETVIGNWMKSRKNRARIVIATKVGAPMGDGSKGLGKDHIRRSAEASLKRLGTDVIDLYQSHFDDETTPIEETLGAHASLIKEGKVRAIGASNLKVPRIAESLAVSARLGLPRYETLQPLYNVYDRADYEGEREALCVKHGLGVIPYYALAAGFLTGKYRSEKDLGKSPRGGMKVKNYLTERGFRILKALDEVAARHDAKTGQIAVAWLMAKPSVTAPIVSATSLAQFEETFAAARIALPAADIAFLDKASA